MNKKLTVLSLLGLEAILTAASPVTAQTAQKVAVINIQQAIVETKDGQKARNELQAKFSMEFCMASLLLYGKAGLSEFTNQVVNRPEVQEMMRRVEFGVDPVAEAAGYNKMTTIVEIRLKDGRTVSGRADVAKGNPANPMSFAEEAAKFMDCAAYARWPIEKARSIVDMVASIEKVGDVRALTALCVRA